MYRLCRENIICGLLMDILIRLIRIRKDVLLCTFIAILGEKVLVMEAIIAMCFILGAVFILQILKFVR